MKWYRKFHIKYLAIQLLILLIILGTFSLVLLSQVTSRVKNEAFDDITLQREVLKSYIELQLENIQNSIGLISKLPSSANFDFNELDPIIQELIKLDPIITQVYVMDTTGMQIYKSSYPETMGSRSDRDYFQKAIQGEKFFSEVIISRSTNTPITVYAEPIYQNYKIIGVIGCSIDLDFLSHILEKSMIGKKYAPDKSYGFILDSTGNIIGHPNSDYVKELKNVSYLEPVRQFIEGKSGTGNYYFEGIDKLVSFSTLDLSNWGIFVQIPEQEAYKNVALFRHLFLFTICILLLMIIVFSILQSFYLKSPISNILSQIKEFEQNRSIHLVCSMRKDEFSIIQDSFITMADRINKDQLELEDRVKLRTDELLQEREKLVRSEKINALSRMTMNFAHEINTPLGSLIVISDYMNNYILSVTEKFNSNNLSKSDFCEFLTHMEDSFEISNKSLNQIQMLCSTITTIDASSFEEESNSLSLYDFLENQTVELQFLLKNSNISLIIDYSKLSQNIFILHCDKLVQLLKILINNSATHGLKEKDHVEIMINIYNDVNLILIDYKDSGINLSEEAIDKIFEPHFKENMGSRGKGIGLTIAHTLVEKFFNGKISCSNVSPTGLRFFIEIPME